MVQLSIFVVIAIAITAVVAEPPRFGRQRFSPTYPGAEPPRFQAKRFRPAGPFFARQQVAVSTAIDNGNPAPPKPSGPEPGNVGAPGGAPYPPASGPYPPSGFRPAKAFNLPTEQKAAPTPSTSYGPPAATYLPPSTPAPSYGPPATPAPSYGPPSKPTPSYGPPAQDENPNPEFPEAEAEAESVPKDQSEATDLARFRAEKLQNKKPEEVQSVLLLGLPQVETLQRLTYFDAPVVNQRIAQTQPVLVNAEPAPQKGFSYVSQVSTW